MPFSARSLDFLFENKMHDSREWFNDHKEEYKELITKPFTEVVTKLAPAMEQIDSRLVCTPKRISRVYRDTRFTKDKSLFRDNIWLSISYPKCERKLPEFYVGISGEGISCGCGYYQIPPAVMEEIRGMIISGHKLFKAAKKSLDEQNLFTLGGDMYKRNHFPEQSKELCYWLNRRNIYAYHDSRDFDLMFSDKFGDKMAEELILLKPFFEFLTAADEMAAAKEYHE